MVVLLQAHAPCSHMRSHEAGLSPGLRVQVDGSSMQVALQWCSDSFSDQLVGFVNNVKTIDGGTHMDGLKSALTRTINTLAKCAPA